MRDVLEDGKSALPMPLRETLSGLLDQIDVLSATALSASAGDLHRFESGRHFEAWLRLKPREHSSG